MLTKFNARSDNTTLSSFSLSLSTPLYYPVCIFILYFFLKRLVLFIPDSTVSMSAISDVHGAQMTIHDSGDYLGSVLGLSVDLGQMGWWML